MKIQLEFVTNPPLPSCAQYSPSVTNPDRLTVEYRVKAADDFVAIISSAIDWLTADVAEYDHPEIEILKITAERPQQKPKAGNE